MIARAARVSIIIVALSTLAGATSSAGPLPSFGLSESGCPFFFPATADGPDADPGQVGPFGTSQQHLTGIGFAADGSDLTVSLQVQDMRRQSAPGHRWSYWEVFFSVEGQSRGKQLEIYYDAVQDQFSWWAGPRNVTVPLKTQVTGTVVPGPGGGVAITVPFSALELKPGDFLHTISAEAGNFVSYVYMDAPNWLTGTYPSGVYAPQWDIQGPAAFQVIPCPGIAVRARDLRNGNGVRVEGGVLPAESDQPVGVEQLTEGGWVEVAAEPTGIGGLVSVPIQVPPGEVTLRATVTTRMLGDVTSAPVTVTAT